mgnify:CR=1 FL=1
MPAHHRRQAKPILNGLTLLEALLFLSIAASVLTGSVMLFNQSNERQKVQQVTSELLRLVDGIDTLYSSRPDFTGLDMATLVAADVPRRSAGGVVETPWGDDMRVTLGPPGPTRANIQFALPQEACRTLASGALVAHPLIDSIEVGATTWNDPADPSTIGAACDASETAFAVSVIMRKP